MTTLLSRIKGRVSLKWTSKNTSRFPDSRRQSTVVPDMLPHLDDAYFATRSCITRYSLESGDRTVFVDRGDLEKKRLQKMA